MAGTARLVSKSSVPISPIAAIGHCVFISLMPSIMKLKPSPNTIPITTKRGTSLAIRAAAPLKPSISQSAPVTRPAL